MPTPRLFHAADPTFGTGSLSPDLEAAAARRLGALALVVAGVATTMGTIELTGGLPSALDPVHRAGLMAIAVAISIARRPSSIISSCRDSNSAAARPTRSRHTSHAPPNQSNATRASSNSPRNA